MQALITFIREEMEHLGITQIELAQRSGIPNSTLSRHLNNEVGEWRPSVIYKIATGLNQPFSKLMSIAGFPVEALAGVSVPDRLAYLIEAFPWLSEMTTDVAELKPEDQQSVLAFIETLQRRQKGKPRS